MSDLWTDLIACLDLSPTEDGYQGGNLHLEYHRLFGGQLLAQAVTAAALACPGKTVSSLHTVFPRAGRAEEPVRYTVQRHHEGRTLASLTITAAQSGGTIAVCTAALHAADEAAPEHQDVPPVPDLPGPEHELQIHLLPFETRSRHDLDSPAARPPDYELWWRSPANDHGHAVTGYATDLTLIGTALLPLEGLTQRDAGTAFTSAVTSHTLWFHRAPRTDDWLLLRQHSPVLAGGRCFGRGDVLSRDGLLVASYAQEGLLRFRR